MEQFLQFLHTKRATLSPGQFLKIFFSSSSCSDKMRWGRGWPKQLYVKTWNFTERDFGKVLLLFKGQVYKNISRYYDFKITSLTQYLFIFFFLFQYYLNLYCQIWKCFCLLRLILDITTANNFSKSRKFSREISALEFCYS